MFNFTYLHEIAFALQRSFLSRKCWESFSLGHKKSCRHLIHLTITLLILLSGCESYAINMDEGQFFV